MPTPLWQYDPNSRTYVNLRTGQIAGPGEMLGLRDRFAEALNAESDRLARRLTDREITIQQWTTEMRRLVKDAFVAQYAAAVGGVNNMTQADYGRIGAMMMAGQGTTGQYWYLQRFAETIQAGRLTPEQIAARARLYMSSSVQAFERGKSTSYGMPRLPAYPGDGSTQCLVNCRCSWEIVEDAFAWRATWSLGNAEHCPDCLSRAAMWAPYVVLKGGGVVDNSREGWVRWAS